MLRAATSLEAHAKRILERRRLRPDRDADVRGDRAVRARRRGGDRHRPEGDVHLRRRRRALADAAPRGHRAGLPRLRRARHAQAAAAGEALVPVELLPRRGAADGALPPVLAGRRRGDRLGGPGDRRRADRAARRAARRARRHATAAAARRASAQPETRAAYREELGDYLRAHEHRARAGGARADRPQPDARVRLRAIRERAR